MLSRGSLRRTQLNWIKHVQEISAQGKGLSRIHIPAAGWRGRRGALSSIFLFPYRTARDIYPDSDDSHQSP